MQQKRSNRQTTNPLPQLSIAKVSRRNIKVEKSLCYQVISGILVCLNAVIAATRYRGRLDDEEECSNNGQRNRSSIHPYGCGSKNAGCGITEDRNAKSIDHEEHGLIADIINSTRDAIPT